MNETKKKVAIACQGGGSHAAFAAGVLMRLFEPDLRDRYELVALSGTSGGAMCAALAWAGLVRSGPREGADHAIRNLQGFWSDLQAKTPEDALLNFWGLVAAEAPLAAEISPYFYSPTAEPRVMELLERYADLGSISLPQRDESGIALLIGATQILSGERVIFTTNEITERHVVASAAIPTLFRAVEIDDKPYWDGLFATNPPIREFTEEDAMPRIAGQTVKPDEIWVIQINPQKQESVPHAIGDIIDRRNELSGNLSLSQELYFIDKINKLTDKFKAANAAWPYQHIEIKLMEMPFKNLSYASKLDRSPAFIEKLIQAGFSKGIDFINNAKWNGTVGVPKHNTLV